MLNVSQSDLGNLEALLLNNAGNVPLHNRFRALFTLKALKSEEAVHIISKGPDCFFWLRWQLTVSHAGFEDPSALLKHELAYCLGQMKNAAALPILESVLASDREDPMVRHEVSCFTYFHRCNFSFMVLMGFHIAYTPGSRGDGCYFFDRIFVCTKKVSK